MAFKALRAIVSVIFSIAIMAVIYTTFGTALATFEISAKALVPMLTLSAGWRAIATTSAALPDQWFMTFLGFCLALIIYGFLSLFTSTGDTHYYG